MRAFISAFLLATQLLLIMGSVIKPLLRLQDRCQITNSECLKARFQSAIYAFAEGIPETGFERLDPMLIDNLNIERNDFKIQIKNLNVNGLRNSVVDHFSIDPIENTSKQVRLVYRSDLRLTGQYATNGKLFSLPISGEGDITILIDNVEIDMQMPYDIIKDVHGRDVVHLNTLDYSFDIKNQVVNNFTNLYYGDEQASDKMHALLNSNWRKLSSEFGKYFFDLITSRFFIALRKGILTQPIQDVLVL